ncbi:hypothetical protein, partial [Anaerotignum sp.]
MMKLIVGNKGSGKTKTLISMVNDAVAVSKGNVVCIEKGSVMTFDINYKARLVDIDNYDIVGYEAFYGFLTGILAGNYDITHLFVDATLRIGGRDYAALADMLAKLNKVVAERGKSDRSHV